MKTFQMIMNNKRGQLIFGLIASLSSSLTHAGFLLERQPEPVTAQVEKAPSVVQKKSVHPDSAAGRNVDLSAKVNRMAKMNRQRIDLESRVTSRITQSGTVPSELQILRGMGRGVSIEDALRQILPAGWGAYSDQDLPESNVDWEGTRTWPMVLHAVLTQYDMRAHIDWDAQELMLFVPAPAEAPVAVTETATGVKTYQVPAPASGETAQAAQKASTRNAPAATPALTEIAPLPQWTLSTEKTLRENLRIWSSQAGWNLVWSATVGDTVVDYPVDATVTFVGDLVGVNGAMAKVIVAYSDADRPLEIEFFKGNKVIEVRLHRIPDVRTNESAPQNLTTRLPLVPESGKKVFVPANGN
ncbi:hypothetical protein CBP36_19920 (plasmid) [Acidovorax carolinensis]|uniref:Toxin co-regulated pilus biosynthesis protein Q C-terminal domain-containing protein n=1 Tax=Acidovorax carolinensis TaxID=553814 RepID=A0A240UJE0_9BURK|nr:TcpQ domain-containing protein [Acidovorax carolinensis]ART57178.1 hypothetical protein CBP35_19890 [Acidovorax carolinensis]ART61236.1 hypothetical protein CBP36_19920 [Acidovorax carolinensis]